MNEVTTILKDLFIIFVAAKLVGEIFERLHQPAVIGELLVGIGFGPFALGWIGVPGDALVELFHDDREIAAEALHLVFEVLAEIGVVVLLFFVGLESRVSDILNVGVRAAVVAVMGVVVPFALGFGLAALLFDSNVVAAFLGAAMVATSVGITARVLRDIGVLQSREARIILGAAVIDDILGLLVLAVVSGMAGGKELSPLSIGLIIIEAAALIVFTGLIGTHLVRHYSIHWSRLRTSNAPFVIAIIFMLGMAVLSSYIGLAAIIGAFLAGMMLAEAEEHYELEHRIMPVYEVMVPFFFVFIGMQVDLRLFLDTNILGLSLGVTGLAMISKILPCGISVWGYGRRNMAIVGFGMMPRGEVGLIVAGIGKSLGVIPDPVFSAVVVMSILTTFVTPPILKLLYAGYKPVEATPGAFEQAGHLPDM